MTDAALPIPMDRLLEHRDWVRALARRLMGDEHGADDLEQQVWVAALRSPPRHEGTLRGWLTRVTQNQARKLWRTDSRRETRERAHGSPRAAPAAVTVVAETEAHRNVVDAVLSLEEPYRTTLLLRYFENLPPRDIAAQMDAPVATVRTRVRRGVEQVRARLVGDAPDERKALGLILAPLLDLDADAVPADQRAFPLAAALLLMVASAAAVFVTLSLTGGATGDDPADDAVAVIESADIAAPPAAATSRRRRPADRAAEDTEAVAGQTGEAPEADAPTAPGTAARARVLYSKEEDGPQEFTFRLRPRGGDPITVTGKDGTFDLTDIAPGKYGLSNVVLDGVSYVGFGRHVEIGGADDVLRFPRPRTIRIQVVEKPSRRPIPHARIHRWQGDRMEGVLAPHQVPGPATRASTPVVTDERGWATLESVTPQECFFAVADGYAWSSGDARRGDEMQLWLGPGGSVLLTVTGTGGLSNPVLAYHSTGDRESIPNDAPAHGGMVLLEGGRNYRNIDLPEDGHTVRIEGLRAVPSRFVVARKRVSRKCFEYGSVAVTIRRGETLEATLACDPPAGGPARRLSGVLELPEDYRPEDLFLTLMGAGEQNRDVLTSCRLEAIEGASTWNFDSRESVPPGRYFAYVNPLNWWTEIDAKAGSGPLHILVPRPARITLVVTDEQTGDPVDGARIWAHGPEGPRNSTAYLQARAGEKAGTYLLETGPGPFTVYAEADGRRSPTQQLTLGEDERREVRLVLAPKEPDGAGEE